MRPVARVRDLLVLGPLDDLADRQVERRGERVVALVVAGHRHDRAGPVLHEHVVGDVHRDLLAVDRVGHGAAEEDAGLGPVGVAALLVGLVGGVVDVVADLVELRSALGQAQHVGVLGRHDEERRAEQRVRARREDRVVRAERAQRNVTSRPPSARSSCAASS
jgi:hypothetical protein